MLEWIMRQLIGWATGMMQSFIKGFLNSFDCSTTLFTKYFPFVVTIFPIIQSIALAIIFLILLFQLLKCMTAPLHEDNELDNPPMLIIKTILFIFLILFAPAILSMLLKLTQTMYNWILNADATKLSVMTKSYDSLSSILTSTSTDTLLGGGVVGLIVGVVIAICIGWNFLKVILEAAERYMVVCVMYYLSPLAFATGSSKSTSNIFKGYCRLLASQLVLMILNVWGIKAILSAFVAFAKSGGMTSYTSNTIGSLFLWSLCVFVFEKCIQKLDEYMHDMGMTVAQTGGSLVEEIIGAGASVKEGLQTVSAGVLGSDVAKAAGKGGIVGAVSAVAGSAGFAKAAADKVSTGGTKQGLGGIIGAMAGHAATKQFVSGLTGDYSSGINTSHSNLATKMIDNVAKGDIKSNGIIADGIGAGFKGKNTSYGSQMGTASMLHYFGETAGPKASAACSVGNKGNVVVDDSTVGSGSFKGTPMEGMKVSNVTMGGGSITGTATNSNGESIPFRMDSSTSAQAPEGSHFNVSDNTGTQWYTQLGQQKTDKGGVPTGEYQTPKRPMGR